MDTRKLTLIDDGRVVETTANFDDAGIQLAPADLMAALGWTLKDEGLCLGGSSGINVAGAIRLARDLGLDVGDTGPLHLAKHLEYLASLWIYMAFEGGWGRNFTFKVLKR